jgi:cytosine/adenosine deaminase-related metal-dependent hydrolase
MSEQPPESFVPLTVYTAPIVLPVTSPRIVDGAVAVKDGRILHVGDRRWVLDQLNERGIDYREEHFDGAICPGLVNAHTHLQYTHMHGVAQRHYNGFDDWGDAFDLAYGDGDHDWSAAAADGARQLLRSGTTSAADVVTDIAAFSALHDAGMHGIAFWEIYGKSNADWKGGARDELIDQIADLPFPPGAGVSPHAPYSLEVSPLLEIPDIAREAGLRLHIHLAEAHMERALRGDTSSWASLGADSFRALRSRGVGVSSTQFVDHLGVLGPDCHIAHGVYVDAEDRALLRARGTTVALCPRSNTVIGLDMPPIADYLREGNPVAVGTDSLSSSPSLDLLEDVGLLYELAREQGYGNSDLHQRLFYAATLGGATAVGLQGGKERVGQIGVGAAADLSFFDVPTGTPDDALAAIVEDGAGRNMKTVLSGETVFTR